MPLIPKKNSTFARTNDIQSCTSNQAKKSFCFICYIQQRPFKLFRLLRYLIGALLPLTKRILLFNKITHKPNKRIKYADDSTYSCQLGPDSSPKCNIEGTVI